MVFLELVDLCEHLIASQKLPVYYYNYIHQETYSALSVIKSLVTRTL